MRKTYYLLVMFLCFMGVSVVLDAASLKKSANSAVLGDSDVADIDSSGSSAKGDAKASSSATSKTEKAKENSKEEYSDTNANEGLATLPNGPAYVGVYTDLKLRDGIYGNILAELYNNEKVTITGRDGDWYKVSTTKGDGYAHARYIFDAPNKRYHGNEASSSGSNGGSNNYTSGGTTDVVINVSGDSVQGKVVSAAQQLVEKYSTSGSFPYDPATNGGNLGCAQVVTTALKAAGVINQTCLNCHGTIDLLNAAGWTSVTAPPYQAGDVIFWATYKPNTESHVGIIMTSGNTAQAMSNSSSQHKPRYHDAEYNGAYPVMRVMRKV